MKYIFFIIFSCIGIVSYSQSKSSIPLVIADSLSSGTYKDVFKSFFQVAVDNLTGQNKELKFSSNPFAIMLKSNPELALDKNYVKYKALRNLNFDIDAKLDSNYHFNGFASGITYALINRRDYTVYHEFIDMVLEKTVDIHSLHLAIAIARNGITDTAFKRKVQQQEISLFKVGGLTFDKLDKDVQNFIIKVASDNNIISFTDAIGINEAINLGDESGKVYDSIKNSFQNKHLLTIGVADTTYSDGFFFKNLVFNAESVRGILNPDKAVNIQWDFKASDMFYNDSTKTDRNLKRQLFSFEPGFNLVIKNKSTQVSWLEFKLSGEYNHIFNGLYSNEKKDSTTLNGTLRIKILDDLWVPLEIKYDPKNGNVFGFLNVRFNFTGLNKKEKVLAQS